MCGVAGFVGRGDTDELSAMGEALSHRGPDDRGIISFDNVGLSHARLAVIDLSAAGHQPMESADGRFVTVYNGELYNFKQLKSEIGNRYPFKSESDTEVILAAFSLWGVECFKRFEGMFALAIYDKHENSLVLARDRFGQKPLFWYRDDKSFVFSSEMKSLLKHGGVAKEVNETSLASYLLNNFTPAPDTMIKGVKKLSPGHFLKLSGGEVIEEPYWQLPLGEVSDSFDGAVGKTRELLREAVERRLVSDVPLGVFLSGGLDSSVVAAVAREFRDKVDTFSVSFDDSSFDESAYANIAADHLKTNHHTYKVTAADMLEVVPKVPTLFDDPVADVSIIPTYLLSKHTRKDVTVALGGDGADELFAGYPTFAAETIARPITKIGVDRVIPKAKMFAQRMPDSGKYMSSKFKLLKFIEGFEVDESNRHYRWLGPFGMKDIGDILRTGATGNYPDIGRYIRGGGESGNELLAKYTFSYLLDQTLVKVDRASMANSLEVRSPFLDHKLAEYIFSLPYSYKYQVFKTKRVLKSVAESYLPREIVDREKHGFTVPLASWLRGDLRDWMVDTLSDSNVMSAGLKYKPISKLVDEHLSERADNHRKLWNLLSFVSWYNHFLK